MNVDTKILNKILAKQIYQYIKSITYHDQVGLISGVKRWFNMPKKKKTLTYILRQKKHLVN